MPNFPAPSQRQLEAWVREWQMVLRLQDWKVLIELSREKEMKSPSCHGLCWYHDEHKRAKIWIRHPLDYQDPGDFPMDIECTVVHELLHLHFAPFYDKEEGARQTAQEMAIEMVAHGLVNLKRVRQIMVKQAAAGTAAKTKKKPPVKGAGGATTKRTTSRADTAAKKGGGPKGKPAAGSPPKGGPKPAMPKGAPAKGGKRGC
jgi:hypothetical protein